MPQTFKAFIFDLDGTLVDSAAIVAQVMKKWSHEHGVAFSAIVDSAHSSRTEDTIRSVAPHLDAKRESEKIEAMEREALTDLNEIEGASKFLHQIPEKRWAIATSSSSLSARAKLEAVGITVPKVLIGADKVLNGKPHPEAYLTASKDLGIDPSDCLAFEDSETGVRSALAAGCHVLLLGSHCQAADSKIIGRIEYFTQLDLIINEDDSMELNINL